MTSVADADLYLNEVNPKKAIGSNAGIYVEENELKKAPWTSLARVASSADASYALVTS